MVAVVGRLDPNKHIGSLLAVLPPIVRDVPDLRVVICGRSVHVPGHDDELRQQASSLGLDEHVRFLGHYPDVPSILAAADVFCLPTEMEAFGLVFIEAMRAGLPVVAVRSGGVPEIVADGVTGLLSYPRDLAGLEANLRRVLVDRSGAQAMGIAGRERFDRVFDGSHIAGRWITVVESVVRESRRG
jgi:glycosyltransferase involved in cell wall biosynthesis